MIRSDIVSSSLIRQISLLGKGCYMPSVDLVECTLRLAEKILFEEFIFGLYDTGHY